MSAIRISTGYLYMAFPANDSVIVDYVIFDALCLSRIVGSLDVILST